MGGPGYVVLYWHAQHFIPGYTINVVLLFLLHTYIIYSTVNRMGRSSGVWQWHYDIMIAERTASYMPTCKLNACNYIQSTCSTWFHNVLPANRWLRDAVKLIVLFLIWPLQFTYHWPVTSIPKLIIAYS